MEKLAALPERIYDYVYGNYGTVGLIAIGLVIVVCIVGIFVWLDRRK